MDIAISIIVTFLLTLANGYFSMSEMALSTAKKAILAPMQDTISAKDAKEPTGSVDAKLED